MAASSSIAEMSASISGFLDEKHRPEHLQVLKTFTAALREKEHRDAVDEAVLSPLLPLLTRLSDELHSAGGQDVSSETLELQLTAECFRAQRNACVQSTGNQKLLRDLGLIDVSLKLLNYLLTKEDQAAVHETLRCGVQFIGNVAVGNQMCKEDVWRSIVPDHLLQLLCVDDEKTVTYASMVLHTCLDDAKVETLALPQNISLALKVMELCRTQPDIDWTVIIATQHFLKCAVLVESMYTRMQHQDRVTLLELLLAQLREDESECGIPPAVASFLASSFQSGCGAVLTLATGSVSSNEVLQEALTVISLLDVLCEMSSDHGEFMFLQDHADLLANTTDLLAQVHAIGKSSKNIFSASQNFSLGADAGSSHHSPVVSFKAHLIRLIGNLCHNNARNQNKVRELDGIPLILDNCNIDSNNPFINQWAIFAVRNLLENNAENQSVVASMQRRGALDYAALRELGLEAEQRGGALLLKSLRKDP
ncbi:ataxin-10 [Eucyclogobius newberryi]|uniref:ataxin-10 n=1 Tax=Eucyclogobius newberryi TaxID=166745 RepID=UPI003B5A41AD